MAENCKFWKSRNCDFPPGAGSTNRCSWLDRNCHACAVYKMSIAQARGGGMEDQLRAAGILPSGALVAGGRRSVGDDDIVGIRRPGKRWWQFWKK